MSGSSSRRRLLAAAVEAVAVAVAGPGAPKARMADAADASARDLRAVSSFNGCLRGIYCGARTRASVGAKKRLSLVSLSLRARLQSRADSKEAESMRQTGGYVVK